MLGPQAMPTRQKAHPAKRTLGVQVLLTRILGRLHVRDPKDLRRHHRGLQLVVIAACDVEPKLSPHIFFLFPRVLEFATPVPVRLEFRFFH